MESKQNGTSADNMSFLEVLKHKDILRTEIIAGITGFFAISYIIIVNPMILKDAGIPADLSVFATILVLLLAV